MFHVQNRHYVAKEDCNFMPLTNSSTLFNIDNDTKQIKNMNQWLPARRLVKKLDINNDKIWSDSLNKILSLFGKNKQELLYFFINIANQHQLNGIIEILSSKIKNNQSPSYKKQQFHFKHLSEKSGLIQNVCEFLTKSEINSFKLISINTAISCLNMMNLRKLSVFNMNELLFFKEYWHNLHNLTIGNLEKTNYFNPNITCSLLKQIWSKKYNIPYHDILISQNRYYHTKNTKLYEIIREGILAENVNNFSLFKSSFYILDKRNIIILNKTISKPLSLLNTNNINYNDYRLMVLEYFDFIQKQLIKIQFLLIHHDIKPIELIKYLENGISSTMKHIPYLSWLDSLKLTIDKMKQFEPNDTIFKLFNGGQCITDYNKLTLFEIVNNNKYGPIITFQLNDNHLIMTDYTKQIIWNKSCLMNNIHIARLQDLYPNLMTEFKRITKVKTRIPTLQQIEYFFVRIGGIYNMNESLACIDNNKFNKFYIWFHCMCLIIKDLGSIYNQKEDPLIGLFFGRLTAEQALKYKPEGTFILRLASQKNGLAITYKNKNDKIQHILLTRISNETYKIGKFHKSTILFSLIRPWDKLKYLYTPNKLIQKKFVF